MKSSQSNHFRYYIDIQLETLCIKFDGAHIDFSGRQAVLTLANVLSRDQFTSVGKVLMDYADVASANLENTDAALSTVLRSRMERSNAAHLLEGKRGLIIDPSNPATPVLLERFRRISRVFGAYTAGERGEVIEYLNLPSGFEPDYSERCEMQPLLSGN